MQNILRNTRSGDQSATPWILLLMLAAYVVAGLFLLTIIAQGIILPFYNFNLEEVMSVISNPYGSDNARLPLMVIQGVTSFGAFVVVPLFFIRVYLKLEFGDFLKLPKPVYQPIFMTVVIMFCFMIANSILIEWNQGIVFPESLSWLEETLKNKEQQFEKLTLYLTDFKSLDQFLIAFLIIAIVPCIGFLVV